MAGMVWFLLSVLGFALLTAAVVALARSDTARWERESALRARRPAPHHPAGSAPPHARRRRVEFPTGVPAAPAPRAPQRAAETNLDGSVTVDAS